MSNLKTPDIYLYGMTVFSTIHLLDGAYPKADTYGEIKETHFVPGGETGNSAIVLANYGYQVKIDGPFLGTKTKEPILDCFSRFNIDCSGLHYDSSFEGVQDMVLITNDSRTVFGKFGSLFRGPKKWTIPDKAAIQTAKIISLDPFFGEESRLAAECCVANHKPYVTIDCEPDSFLHQNAVATIISNEFIQSHFPGEPVQNLFEKYTHSSPGLVIFTFGSQEIIYGRINTDIKRFIPYKVTVKSTLGAGDTFRAGVVHGILSNFPDEDVLKFAAATAASVCTRFPMAFNPPSLEEITQLINEQPRS